ncbi:MAG: CopG family transcriptional regulator [Magnetococcales bacterium]|nr:CopG family transcriptional regulator [Magnetococcales bacterium]MBF0114973.1 CopG family transcriptional regulator [Magnetococcales bacterium]
MTIAIPADMEEMLQFVAKETGRPLEELVREALDRFLEEWEERQDAEDARIALEEYRRNPGSALPLDDVLRELGFSRDSLR